MALCTQLQVEQRLQIEFAENPDDTITELIAAATGHIERIVGRQIEDGARSETFDPPGNPNVWLTYTPINDTSTSTPFTVTVDGTALDSADYLVDPESGRLTRVVNGRPRSWNVQKVQSIVVDYLGGYETVPYDIQDICARMVARAFQAGAAYAALPEGADGVKQIALQGSDAVTYANTVSDVTMAAFITDAEIEALKYYRHLYI